MKARLSDPLGVLLLFLGLVLVPGGTFAYISRSVDDPTYGFYALFGLVGGIVSFFWGFSQLRTRRLMWDIPLSTIRAMAPGLVEIHGVTVDWCLFEAPLTGAKCVFYEYSIQRNIKSGKESTWETILQGDSRTSPFFLQDGTGMAMVAPRGAVIDIAYAYRLELADLAKVPTHISDFMDRRGVPCRSVFGPNKKLRFIERILRPQEEVFVMGTCQEATFRLDEPPEGFSHGLCVAKGHRSGDRFILSEESQGDLVRAYGFKAANGIVFGLLLIGGCLYALLKIVWVS